MNTHRDEHSCKIAMRLSKLLDVDEAPWRVTFLETRRLYHLRSKMVPAGCIIKDQWNVGADKRTSNQLVEAADLRTINASRKPMQRGKILEADTWTDIELA